MSLTPDLPAETDDGQFLGEYPEQRVQKEVGVVVVVEGREGVELMEQQEAGQWEELEAEVWQMIGYRCQR